LGAPFLAMALAVVVSKLAFYLADPFPSFQFGDSGAYLATALVNYIPPDRSFTYGFLLRPLVLSSHSLLPVVIAQIIASAVASVVLGSLLLTYANAKSWVAVIFAFASALEPLQLMAERFVMTEAIATVGFAIYIWNSASFLRSRRISTLICAQVVGVALVSLRYSFLPTILLFSLALPVLANCPASRANRKVLFVRMACALILSQLLLSGYRHLYGKLAHTEPQYLSRDGDFLVADMAPILKPGDFPITSERLRFAQGIKIPLGDLRNRRLHRWVEGGVCQTILTIAKGDQELANKLARSTALRAMKRDPVGVLRLGLVTYSQFFSPKHLAWALRLNQGHFSGPSSGDIKLIRDWFGVDALDRMYGSLTKRWVGKSGLWCVLVVLLPWLYAFEMLWHREHVTAFDGILLLSALCLLGSAIVPVDVAYPRYLIPLPWLCVLILGVMVSRLYPAKSGTKLQL
jgi:hypothetical protein